MKQNNEVPEMNIVILLLFPAHFQPIFTLLELREELRSREQSKSKSILTREDL